MGKYIYNEYLSIRIGKIYVWFFNNNRIVIWYILIRVDTYVCMCHTLCDFWLFKWTVLTAYQDILATGEDACLQGLLFGRIISSSRNSHTFFPWIHGFTPRSPVVKKSEGTKLAKTSSCFTDPSSATIGKWNCQKRAATRHNTSETPKDLRLPHLKP